MQPLTWWVSGHIKIGVPVIEELVYTAKFSRPKLLIVENDDEFDLACALQCIYGSQVEIIIGSRVTLEDIMNYLDNYARVYTSWDPIDTQR